MIITAVWVPGHPKTKGSLDFFGKGKVRETVDNKAWRELVTGAVRRDIETRHAERVTRALDHRLPGPYAGPVAVDVTFWLDHPDVYGPSSQAGDLDKLIRLIGDALTDAGAYKDDNQIALFPLPIKLPSRGIPGNAGALIVVRSVSAEELALLTVDAGNRRIAVQVGSLR